MSPSHLVSKIIPGNSVPWELFGTQENVFILNDLTKCTHLIGISGYSDDVQELLDFHNQELTIDELIEMHEQEQDMEELESLDPVQSEDRITELWFQQDGATCHTARATIDLLKDTFGDRLISRFGPVNWPPRSCDLTLLDYFL
ncbi:hypothetical protein TNCV_4467661 [Trichonephila clavipes]|nr:hypothetical protein TNCV_4467661 [Trichonephila clavipes]